MTRLKSHVATQQTAGQALDHLPADLPDAVRLVVEVIRFALALPVLVQNATQPRHCLMDLYVHACMHA